MRWNSLSTALALVVALGCAPAGGPSSVPGSEGFQAARVTVRVDGATLVVERAIFTLEPVSTTPIPREQLAGTIRVEAADGTPLAVVDVPRPEPVSVIAEDGAEGEVAIPELTTVVVPWPENAHVVRGSGPGVTPFPPAELAPASPPPGAMPAPAGAVPAEMLPSVVPIHQSGPSDRRFDFVLVGDGYGAANHGEFVSDARRFSAALFAIEPYATFRDRINVWAVPTRVSDSGTALSCAHGCSGISRLICCDDGATFAAARSAVPGAESVLVLVRSTMYGGSGGRVAISYNGPHQNTVMLHELGHTLGLLDEYVYAGADASVYAADPGVNCSAADPTTWEHWRGEAGVGAFMGCRFGSFFRPTDDSCLMRRNEASGYCPVCREHVALKIYAALGGLVESATPEPRDDDGLVDIEVGDEPVRFEVMDSAVGTPAYAWTLDFGAAGEDAPSLEVDACSVRDRTLLDLAVTDHTDFVREDPMGYTTDNVRWSLVADEAATVDGCLPMCLGEACEIGQPCCALSTVCYPTGPEAGAPGACCGVADVPCGDEADCCGEMQCDGGRCVCQEVGDPCVDHRECCGAAYCEDGTCTL